jgi:hypothetical protein
MPSDHAKLSASGSERWMKCPGSVVLESFFEDEGSRFAEEGTKAHALAEARLRAIIEPKSDEARKARDQAEATADDEMKTFTAVYVEYCKDLIDDGNLRGRTTRAWVEQRVSFSEYVPDGFGTVDFCCIAGDDLHIVDLKYGKGVPVSAIGNTQERTYALGTLQELGFIFDNIKTVTTHIVQPRIGNISRETLTVDELTDWGENTLKPKAQRAYAGMREYSTGKQCKFCKAKALCRYRATTLLGRVVDILGGQTK